MAQSQITLSKYALWLGFTGLLPQVFACALAITNGSWGIYIPVSGFAYAALIFSFLGGVWWGNALSSQKLHLWIFVAAVCPSLIAWIAALLIFVDFRWRPYSNGAIAIGLIISPLIDQQIGKIISHPKGWMKLRWILSIGLGFLTLIIAAQSVHAVSFLGRT